MGLLFVSSRRMLDPLTKELSRLTQIFKIIWRDWHDLGEEFIFLVRNFGSYIFVPDGLRCIQGLLRVYITWLDNFQFPYSDLISHSFCPMSNKFCLFLGRITIRKFLFRNGFSMLI